ncbi:DUF4198 domain-containing protein [Thalassospira lucentensis]|uniref:DUF4198 domain-containing protein n=1 Tax=Thalassospira lucentensis TaxID=168935 RepID=UPI003AA951C2
MFQSKFATSVMIGAIGCLFSGAVSAHEFTLITSPSDAKAGETMTYVMDSSHVFGKAEEAEAAKHLSATLITADQKTDLDFDVNADAPNQIGTFDAPETAAWLSAHRLPVVWSQTPDGWQEGGADEHPDAVAAVRYEKFAKDLVGAASGDKADAFITAPIGDQLEIVPLSDPRETAIGDDATFQILLDGQPLTTSVLATYAGFTDTPSSWAYATETLTDERGSGIAKVRISAPGTWIVRVATDVADEEEGVRAHNLRATLTFDVAK